MTLKTPAKLDPIKMQKDMNHLYLYARNNPTIKIDPNGLWSMPAPGDPFMVLLVEQIMAAIYEAEMNACRSMSSNSERYVPVPLMSMPMGYGMTGAFFRVNKDCRGNCSFDLFIGDVAGGDGA